MVPCWVSFRFFLELVEIPLCGRVRYSGQFFHIVVLDFPVGLHEFKNLLLVLGLVFDLLGDKSVIRFPSRDTFQAQSRRGRR